MDFEFKSTHTRARQFFDVLLPGTGFESRIGSTLAKDLSSDIQSVARVSLFRRHGTLPLRHSILPQAGTRIRSSISSARSCNADREASRFSCRDLRDFHRFASSDPEPPGPLPRHPETDVHSPSTLYSSLPRLVPPFELTFRHFADISSTRGVSTEPTGRFNFRKRDDRSASIGNLISPLATASVCLRQGS